MQVTINVKDWFLDRAAVAKRLSALRHRALMKGGSYTRRAARDLLRAGKNPSEPGRPPKIHSPEPNIKTIFFFLDPATDTVVVGPLKLNQFNQSAIDLASQTVPEILEHGGIINIRESRIIQSWREESYVWRRTDLRRIQREGQENRIRRAIYKPRPFMAPALAKALPAIPEQFRDLL